MSECKNEALAVPKKKWWKRKKFWLWTVAGFVSFFFLLAVLGVLFRNQIVLATLRYGGSFVTGTTVNAGSFRSTLNGRIELRDFSVANPPGYRNPFIFEVKKVIVKVDLSTLFAREIVVENIEVEGTKVDYEFKSDGTSNLSEIQANINRLTGAGTPEKKAKAAGDADTPEKKAKAAEDADTPVKKAKAAEDAAAPPSPPKNEGPYVLLKHVNITGTEILLASDFLRTTLTIPMPPMELNNLGGEGKSLSQTMGELYNTFIGAIVDIVDAAGGGLKAADKAGKVLKDSTVDLGKQLEKSGKEVWKSLKQTF